MESISVMTLLYPMELKGECKKFLKYCKLLKGERKKFLKNY